ncbi:hypothetical protein JCM24511_06154 [Saitozyma sp. JCM 24511]|nr:hypothetical protein JCM24511_06154 [Saitozyma sp. JCM 24511]
MKLPTQWVSGVRVLEPKRFASTLRDAFHARLRTVRIIAKYCPLIAAILAPLSTLLLIPAVAEHWYTRNGVPVRKFPISIFLSAVGMALNLLANVLLILRFSFLKDKRWRYATSWSTICWLITLVMQIINLTVFGARVHRTSDYEFTEGFWCAVVSLVDIGVICIALVSHYIFDFSFGTMDQDEETEVRLEGRRFMVSVTLFLVVIGFHALTVGYGDLVPTNTWAKILVFPFFILALSLLGNGIVIIFGFIRSRAEQRRDKWRQRYEAAMHAEANKLGPRATLLQELALIHQINKREEMMSQLHDLIWSALALVVFWLSGAAMFQAIEGWSYGNAVYAVVILTTTIGFGDFLPTAPVGRIVWIPYALMAVPIITSFAGETISSVPHGASVIRAHESYYDMRKRLLGVDDNTLAISKGKVTSSEKIPGNTVNEAAPQTDESDAGTSQTQYRGRKLTPRHLVPHRHPHSSSVHRQVERVIGKLREQEDECPMCKEQKSEFTPEEQKVRSEYQVVERIIKARASDDFRSRVRGGGGLRTEELESQSEREEKATDSKGLGERTGVLKMAEKGPDDKEGTSERGEEMDQEKEAAEEDVRELALHLVRRLMELTVRLEAEARQMLLESMDNDIAKTLLIADRNGECGSKISGDSGKRGVGAHKYFGLTFAVQVRDVSALKREDANVLAIWRGETEYIGLHDSTYTCQVQAGGPGPGSSLSDYEEQRERLECKPRHQLPNPSNAMLQHVGKYRSTFAEIIVVGAILQTLESEEVNRLKKCQILKQATEESALDSRCREED